MRAQQDGAMSEHEDWQLEWENYFDDLDHAISRLLDVAALAERQGLLNVDAQLVLTAADLSMLSKRCEQFVNLRILELQTAIYKQNPLLKFLIENAISSSPVGHDDSSQPD
jgi:hypothetical protein